MPDYPALIKTRLSAVTALTALLTGGVRLYTDLPAEGIKPTTLSSAYTNGSKLKPLCVVRGRAPTPFSRVKIKRDQFRPVRQAVEIYLYDDRDAGFATLKSAAALIHTSLEQQRVTGSWKILTASGPFEYRDTDLNNAACVRLEYTVIGHIETA
jgi:hypothetical protein